MKNLIKFSIVMVVLCITACTQTFENTSNEVQKKAQGRLVMKVGNESRTIKPTIGGSDVNTAVLTANGNEIKSWSDDNIISQIENTEDILLDVGNYNFTMTFYNDEGTKILTATTSKDIVAGNNSLNFNMKPVSTGYGNISITLNWDDPSEIYTITAGLYDIANNTPVEDFADSELEITSTEEQTPIATYSKNAVPVGSYIIKFKSYKDNILLNTSTDVIKVAAGITTSTQITLSKINRQYTISYNLNAGIWVDGFIQTEYRNGNKKIVLPTAEKIIRDGYKFAGWYDNDNNKITEIPSDTAKNISVTARWNTNTYTVKFEANDGSGEMTDQTFTYDVEQALTANTFTRKGYEFTGWATSADGEKVYDNNESVKNLTADNNATVTLYAKWIATETFIYVEGAIITGAIPGEGYKDSGIFKDGGTVAVGSFYISDHEVTQAEYTKYCSYGGTTLDIGSGDNYPAYYVSWYDALVYCNKRSMAEGLTPYYTINDRTDPKDWGNVPTSSDSTWNAVECNFEANGYRLPTEAEWEYAARGGAGLTDTQYTYAGSNTMDEVAWHGGNSGHQTYPVKSKKENGLGLYDMSGNVWEWCWDFYDSGNRYLRGGGCYNWEENFCTVSFRSNNLAYNRNSSHGFRVVRTAVSYTITYELNGGTNAESNPASYTVETETITLAAPTKTGYTFDGWYDNANLTGEKITQIAKGSTGVQTLYAKWIATETFIYVKGATITGAITGSGYTASDIFKDGKTVTVPDLYVCDHEVTQAEYTKYCNYGGTKPSEAAKGVGDNYPAYNVSWYDALVYCNKRSMAEGLTPCYTINDSTDPDKWGEVPTSSDSSNIGEWKAVTCNFEANGYRLPTEAEWEYAARGGNGLTGYQYKYAGSDTIGNVAWYDSIAGFQTQTVKSKKANELGLYDMSGNVWECCWDSNDSGNRSTRGGGWNNAPDCCTVFFRNNNDNAYSRGDNHGFRVVRTAKWYNAICTAENVGSVIASLSGEGPYDIAVTGAITNATISAIKGALDTLKQNNSTAKVNLDLSGTTGLISIGDGAFYDCSSLTSVTIGDNVTSIGVSAFQGCGSLTSVTIPDSVTKIGNHAFNGCGLKSVTIGDNVTSIGEAAFCECSSLTSVTIGDKVESIGNYEFGNCSSLASVTIGNSVTSIGVSAFIGCSNLTTVNYKGTEDEWNQISINDGNSKLTDATKNFNAITVTASDVSDTISNLTEGGSYTIIVTGAITSDIISAINTALKNNSNAKVNLDLSETTGLTSIDNEAFKDCTNLTSIIIPDGVTSIGDSAFSHCSQLTSITFPESVTTIGINVFDKCSNLTKFIVHEQNQYFSTLEDGKILCDKNQKNLIAYPSASGSITIPDGITTIAGNAFVDCSQLIDINIPEGVISIGNGAFGRTGFTSVELPDSITEMGTDIFSGCSSLETVKLPNNITSIPKATFFRCHNLSEIVIPSSVTSIGDIAFSACYALKSIDIPDSVTTIERNAFSDCSGLESVTIGNGVTSIGETAFGGCYLLTTVNYRGTQDQWEQIVIDSTNDKLINATKTYDYTGN